MFLEDVSIFKIQDTLFVTCTVTQVQLPSYCRNLNMLDSLTNCAKFTIVGYYFPKNFITCSVCGWISITDWSNSLFPIMARMTFLVSSVIVAKEKPYYPQDFLDINTFIKLWICSY